ncbi:MAG: hypothetical protein K940chlam9_01669, partial [Chlamydiae bacterium]|nr:hypothetical protein [Chlamydiota bacterium]
VLGMLAVAPGAMELGRLLGYSQVATGLALYKYPTLGLALTMMTKVEAQAIGSELLDKLPKFPKRGRPSMMGTLSSLGKA